jgi:hypothetical protein
MKIMFKGLSMIFNITNHKSSKKTNQIPLSGFSVFSVFILTFILYFTLLSMNTFCSDINYSDINDTFFTIPDRAVQRAFRQIKNFSGGDGIISVKLSENRFLWLFGDTFAGGGREKIRSKSKMVRNSIAISDSLLINNPENIKCYWKTRHARPEAFFISSNPHRWYWPLGGIMNKGILYLFLQEIKSTDSSVFGFVTSGNCIAKIKNPLKNPHLWNIEYINVPFYKQHEPGIFCLGSSVFEDKNKIWIYGFHQKNPLDHGSKKMVAASIDKNSDLCDFDSWNPSEPDLLPFSKAAPIEFSVFMLPENAKITKHGKCGAIYSQQGMSDNIMLALSSAPGKPFKHETTIFKSKSDKSRGHFSYAAKAQPGMGFKKGLLCTYIYNCSTLEELMNNNNVYFPRFFRIIFH